MPILTRSEVATAKAGGAAQLQNLSAARLLVPAGTVVYSLTPELRRYVTLQDTPLDVGSNSTVAVPIEAVDAGADGNLPADSLVGAEGSLSASVAVSNPEVISGGKSDPLSVPSEADRDQLRAALEEALQAQAQAGIEATLQEGDILLPGTLALKSIEREEFDPAAGLAASLLTLTLEATYHGEYVRGADLRVLATIALDAQMPSGYVPKEGTLRMHVNEISATAASQPIRLQLDLRRTLNRRIDSTRGNRIVRGFSPGRASQLLQEALPLATAPEIRLTPSWWPWMPLIPFRIEMIAS
jgi:hypothetical protein